MSQVAKQPDLFAESLVAAYLRSGDPFVERHWLLERIEAALARPACRFLLLTGEPGSGKTAVMAWLAGRDPAALRYFIRRDSQRPLNAGDARSLLLTLGHQLAIWRPSLFGDELLEIVVRQRIDRVAAGGQAAGVTVKDLMVSPFRTTAIHVQQEVGDVAGALVGLSAQRMTIDERVLDPANLQFMALIDPAAALSRVDPAARLVVLIDALDELRFSSARPSVVDWLAACPQLPDNIRIVVTSRPDDRLLERFRASQHASLVEEAIDATSAEVRDDLGRYAAAYLCRPEIAAALAAHGYPRLQEPLVTRADGNFQYLVAYLRGLSDAVVAGDGDRIGRLLSFVEEVPGDLRVLYAFFIGLVRDAVRDERIPIGGDGFTGPGYVPAWDALYRPLLGLLAVAREPLAPDEIAALADVAVERPWVDSALARLAQFLDDEGGRFRLYHATLPEYLTSPRTPPHDRLDPGECNARAGRSAYRRYRGRWADADSYSLRHAATHLVLAARATQDPLRRDRVLEALREVEADLGYLETKTRRMGVDTVLSELDLAAGLLAADGTVAVLARLLNREAHQLRRWDPGEHPSQFAQAVHNRAVAIGAQEIRQLAAGRLRGAPDARLLLRWRTSRDSPALVRTLAGHRSWAVGAAIAADGRRAASAGRDGTLRTWNLETGLELAVIEIEPDRDLWAVGVSPAGDLVVGPGLEFLVGVWDFETAELRHGIGAPGEEVSSIAWLDDERRAVVATDSALHLIDVVDGTHLRAFEASEPKVVRSLGQTTVAFLEFSGVLRVRDLATGEEHLAVDCRQGGDGYGTGLAVDAGATRAVTACAGNALTVWDLKNGQPTRRLEGHTSFVSAVAMTGDGARAVSASADKQVIMWDVATGTPLERYTGHSSEVRTVALSADGRRALSGSVDATLRLWDLGLGGGVARPGHQHWVHGAAASEESGRAVTVAVDSLGKVFDLDDGTWLRDLIGHSGWVVDVALVPGTRRAVTAGLDSSVRLWDIDSGEEFAAAKGHRHWVHSIAVAPDGSCAFTASSDGTIRRWGMQRWRSRIVAELGVAVKRVALAPDGERLAYATDAAVGLLDPKFRPVWTRDLSPEVRDLAMSPDGRFIVASCADDSLHLLAIEDGAPQRHEPRSGASTLPGAGNSGRGLTVFAGGSRIAFVRCDSVLEVRDADGRTLATAMFDSALECVRASAGGALLVGDFGGDVHCFDFVDPSARH